MATAVDTEPVAEGLFRVDPPALLAGRCGRCGWTHFPRQTLCPSCRAEAIEETALADEGTVYSYTVVHASPPSFKGPVPYGLGVVELAADGIRVEAILLTDDLERISIGDPVAFTLVSFGEGDEARMTFAYEVKR